MSLKKKRIKSVQVVNIALVSMCELKLYGWTRNSLKKMTCRFWNYLDPVPVVLLVDVDLKK